MMIMKIFLNVKFAIINVIHAQIVHLVIIVQEVRIRVPVEYYQTVVAPIFSGIIIRIKTSASLAI